MANINKTTIVLCAMVLACSVAWEEIWAEDCRKDALTQPDMNLCALDHANKADLELETVYKKLMKKIRPEDQAKLRAAQSAWIEFRKKQCEFNASGTVGGSVHPMVLFYCYADFAYQQTKILQQQFECEEGNLSCAGH